MPANTTALINSPIAPIGKLATRISDWFRGSRPSTPTPIWREPPLGLACKLTGRPVSAAAAHTGSHIWCKTGCGAPTQSKMTPVGRPNSTTRKSSATASSAVWHGSGSNMTLRLVVELPCPVVDGADTRGAQLRVLDLPDLFVRPIDEFGIDPVAVHVL